MQAALSGQEEQIAMASLMGNIWKMVQNISFHSEKNKDMILHKFDSPNSPSKMDTSQSAYFNIRNTEEAV